MLFGVVLLALFAYSAYAIVAKTPMAEIRSAVSTVSWYALLLLSVPFLLLLAVNTLRNRLAREKPKT